MLISTAMMMIGAVCHIFGGSWRVSGVSRPQDPLLLQELDVSQMKADVDDDDYEFDFLSSPALMDSS